MAICREIQHDIDQQNERGRDPSAARRAVSEWAAGYIRKHGLSIEKLALGDERPEDLRARLDDAYRAQAPATPTDVALVEQATVAQIEIDRIHQLRATLRAEAIRRAELHWQWEREDDVRYYVRMFNQDPHAAVAGLKRSGHGLRHLISRWQQLGKSLSEEGTLYGAEKYECIQMQGWPAGIDQLFLSEEAWKTWIDCLASQPVIKQFDIDMLCASDIVPKSIQDRDQPLWQPDPEASRARLRALIDRELAALVALEARFRAQYEEAERAAARDRALARFEKNHRHLLQTLRDHERSLAAAHRALAKHRSGGTNKPRPTHLGVNA
jgi:hypothetical protein